MNFAKAGQMLALTLLIIVLGLFHLEPINSMVADLGRHIINGELFVKTGKILDTNFYSYTEPDFPTVTHHWGAGVIFYFIHELFGFAGLSWFRVIIFLATFLLVFNTARRYASFGSVFFVSVFCLPLLTTRLEVRPESFSYLLVAITLLLLLRYRDEDGSAKSLWVVPLLHLFWVNLHIFFVFGLFLTGVFIIDAWIKGEKDKGVMLFKVWGVSLLASLCNPFFIKGVLTPLTILKEYGYTLAENQSVFFMIKRLPDVVTYPYFIFVLIGTLFIFCTAFIKESFKKHLVAIALVVTFAMLGFFAIRGFKIFALVLIVFAPVFLDLGIKQVSSNKQIIIKGLLFAIAIGMLGVSVTSKTHFLSPYQQMNFKFYFEDIEKKKNWVFSALFGIHKIPAELPGVNASAQFFKANNIKGPIFNNYDIGGYLIYHLYPETKVFVDNRPESYSVSFFKNIYIPMQKEEGTWQGYSKEFGINAIYFYRHDLTPWAQPFLIRRLNDSDWVPIFVDAFALILLKRTEANAGLIKQYELPKSLFRVSPSR